MAARAALSHVGDHLPDGRGALAAPARLRWELIPLPYGRRNRTVAPMPAMLAGAHIENATGACEHPVRSAHPGKCDGYTS
jgi:hypothetical protein